MRRLAVIAVMLLGAGGFATLAFGSTAQGSNTARFDVIFDDARGLIGGQLVKIAGAPAGTIDNVVVTSDFKARVEATIESQFMPFHQDATCSIRPEGLIAENYIDCNPGSPGSPPLTGKGGAPPTVPVTNTTEPVSLLDLFNIFNLPTTERLQVLINELGIGTAARGGNFNDILLRANPTLALARRAISILAHQRGQLATIVDATNTITAQAARHTGDLQTFLDRAAALTSLTAQHRGSLSAAVARLPGLLAEAQPALSQLNTVAVEGTPLLEQIHAAVPALNRVSTDLGPFTAAAKPGLAQLTGALKLAIPAIRETTPLVKTLRAYVSRSLPGTLLFSHLAANLQQHGFVENFLSVTYYIAASLSRLDSTSHMLALLLVGPHNGACGNYATKPVAGCSAHYGSQTAYQPTKAARDDNRTRAAAARRSARDQGAHKRGARNHSGATAQPHSSPSALTALPPSVLPPLPAVHQSMQTLQNLMNYLVK